MNQASQNKQQATCDARMLAAAGLFALLLVTAGCGSQSINTVYGMRSDQGAESVNGTAVLSSMFEQAGHQVTTARRISPLLYQAQTIVWIPDDPHPPSIEQRLWMELWLQMGNRTLIYVGRDFDAAPAYWEQAARQAEVDVALEMEKRRGEYLADWDNQRSAFPNTEFARWFTLKKNNVPRRAGNLQSNQGWLDGIDPNQVEFIVGSRMDVSVSQDLPTAAPAAAAGPYWQQAAEEALEFYAPEDVELQNSLPTQVTVLLDSDQGPLVTQVMDSAWNSSQILIVTNGSFLLNLPLINHQHRRLAARLIAASGPAGRVAFLESDGGRIYFSEPEGEFASGLEVFTVWPLGAIVMQAMLLGIAACFVLFPIFGRPRELDPERRADFGRHVDALGQLLKRSRDEALARELLQQYYRLVRHEDVPDGGDAQKPGPR